MKYYLLLLGLLCSSVLFAQSADTTYILHVDGYDWGAGASRVVLPLGETPAGLGADQFEVQVTRAASCTELPPAQARHTARVLRAHASDAQGTPQADGQYVTLTLFVAPFEQATAPMQYFFNGKCRGNEWLDYRLTVQEKNSGRRWTKEAARHYLPVAPFDLSGKYRHKDGTQLTYAHATPANTATKRPLLIWLHGGGEGGTDPSVALMANRAANYAAPDMQAHFDGAYVLVPQTPTFWMDRGDGEYTRGEVDDRYHTALLGLIDAYLAKTPNVDRDRIYLGGCSNGGYMTMKLLLDRPDFFAAAYPSALAMYAEFITDEQLESIKHVPMWFIHSKDDGTTPPDKTVVPVVQRLRKLGAPAVYFSFYDHVVDLTGLFGGDAFHYPGHFSWVYSHTNHCRLNDDGEPVRVGGQPVTLMAWLAAQAR